MAPRLSTFASIPPSGGDVDAADAAQSELQRGPWVAPADPLEAEWEAVRRTIDAHELARLEEFRSFVRDRGLDAHKACVSEGAPPHSQQAATLLRFLRARNGNCEAAAAMFEEALDWRRDFEIDRKLREWRSEWKEGASARVRLLRKYTFIGLLGQDREGLPIYVHRHSQGDVGGLVREIGSEPVFLFMVAAIEGQLEAAHERMMTTGHCVNNFVEVHDIGNYGHVPSWLSRAFAAVPFYKTYAPVFDKVYPERVRVCFMVRMPAAFNVIWKLILPMVPEATKLKIRLKGFQATSWLEEMQALLPPESIPAWLQNDSATAIAQAQPAGGIVPKGALQAIKMQADNSCQGAA